MAMITFSLTPASFSATKPGHRGIEGAIGGLNLGHDVGIGQLACRLSFSLRLPALSRDLGSFLNLTHGRQQIPGLFGIEIASSTMSPGLNLEALNGYKSDYSLISLSMASTR